MPLSSTQISACEFDTFEHDLHAPALRRELDRIRKQVPQHLLQPVRIATHEANARVQHRLDTNVLRHRRLPHRFDRVVHHFVQIQWLHFECTLPEMIRLMSSRSLTICV